MKPSIFDSIMFEKYLQSKGLAESSIKVYKEAIDQFIMRNPDYEKLEDYNEFLIQRAIKKRGTFYYSILRSFIDFKVESEQLKDTLLKGLIKPKKWRDFKQERKYLTEDQIFDVINGFEYEKHKIIALIQELSGVRVGDIMKLKYGKIISELYKGKEVIRLNITGKRGKRNVVYVHDKVAQDLIMNYILNNKGYEDYYFLQTPKMIGHRKKGFFDTEERLYKINYYWYWRDLKQALEAVGINREDFSTHDYRRCFARRVWDRYKDVNVLQKMLNHTNPATSLRYLEQSGLQNIDYQYEMQTTKQ